MNPTSSDPDSKDRTKPFAAIRHDIQAMIGPKRLLLLVFVILYLPFLWRFGWKLRNAENIDLPTFYAASVQVFKNHQSPYEPERLQAVMGQNSGVFPYLYPPPSLLFFYPLSLTSYTTARLLVLAVNHFFIVALLWVIPSFLMRDRFATGNALPYALTFAYMLTFYPIVVTLNHGQVGLLLLALLLAFWILARAGKPVAAGIFLASAILLKTYPLMILPLLLVAGRKRECLYTVAWLGVGLVVSLVMVPPVIWRDWFINVLPSGGYGRTPAGLFSPAGIWNQSLNGFFSRAFTQSAWSRPIILNPDLGRHLTYGAAIIFAVISAIAVWRASKRDPNGIDRMMMVALPATYLIAPLSWEHHLVYLLPSILIMLTARLKLPTASTFGYYVLSVGSAVLLALDGLLDLKFLGVALLWIMCVFVSCCSGIQLLSEDTEAGAAAPV